jgi:hypothetical protein
LIKDKRAMEFCWLVGLGNGITFSYYAEAPFYLINRLKLTPSQYGLTFILLAMATAVGGLIGRRLFQIFSGFQIMEYGLALIFLGTILLAGSTLFEDNSKELIISLTLGAMVIIMMGLNLTVLSSLSMALEHYQSVLGTASALFGFMYYGIISAVTFLMGALHNDTVLAMPLFFLALSLTMVSVYLTLIRQRGEVTV